MAIRPAFFPDINVKGFVKRENIDFEWFPGFSIIQKQRSINSLHNSISKVNSSLKPLEISSKSEQPLGVSLSAFNLMIETKNNKKFSVEMAFQSSKVFEGGGPFIDLLEGDSRTAKKDSRLKNSGKLLYFQYFKRRWPLDPKTMFYDWLYINALSLNTDLSNELSKYNVFTDIEFNPEKSINCQANSAALYVALKELDLLEYVLDSVENYIEILGDSLLDKSEKQNLAKVQYHQLDLFDD